jgi:hypothetical protein
MAFCMPSAFLVVTIKIGEIKMATNLFFSWRNADITDRRGAQVNLGSLRYEDGRPSERVSTVVLRKLHLQVDPKRKKTRERLKKAFA